MPASSPRNSRYPLFSVEDTRPRSVTGPGVLDAPARRTISPVFACNSLMETEFLPFLAICNM